MPGILISRIYNKVQEKNAKIIRQYEQKLKKKMKEGLNKCISKANQNCSNKKK